MTAKRFNLENWLFSTACVLGLLPTVTLALILLYFPIFWAVKVLILLFFIVFVIFTAHRIKQKVLHCFRTSNNMLDAVLKGDTSLRVSPAAGVLAEQNTLLNTFSEHLAQQRMVSKEQHLLLQRVSLRIDVAIIALDHNNKIILMNPAAEKLFHLSSEQWLGWPIKQLGVQIALDKTTPQLMTLQRQNTSRQVYVSCEQYADQGHTHHLIFIQDIQHLLHEEERQAWKKLLRVLSHEVNNSLTPISAISQALIKQLSKTEGSSVEPKDILQGMQVINERATGLNQFLKSYQQLTKLPMPDKQKFELTQQLATVCGLFDNPIELVGRPVTLYADPAQIQQVLVNLLKNALEATTEQASPLISVSWQQHKDQIQIEVVDNGQGIQNPDNLFVPFYSTKPKGTGIGLVLCRQIVRNHGGDLQLFNRSECDGAISRITLPVAR